MPLSAEWLTLRAPLLGTVGAGSAAALSAATAGLLSASGLLSVGNGSGACLLAGSAGGAGLSSADRTCSGWPEAAACSCCDAARAKGVLRILSARAAASVLAPAAAQPAVTRVVASCRQAHGGRRAAAPADIPLSRAECCTGRACKVLGCSRLIVAAIAQHAAVCALGCNRVWVSWQKPSCRQSCSFTVQACPGVGCHGRPDVPDGQQVHDGSVHVPCTPAGTVEPVPDLWLHTSPFYGKHPCCQQQYEEGLSTLLSPSVALAACMSAGLLGSRRVYTQS